jgi:non-specific serine/threonine protein kinase
LAPVEPGDALRGVLRPYQQAGVQWLYLLTKLGQGACLADDMGLGKTIQVLSLLLILKRQNGNKSQPSVLVAPASLLANWAAEIERFAPGLKALIAHPSALPSVEFKAMDATQIRDVDLVITSYGALLRAPWMIEVPWRLAVLDEAQAIKNHDAKQTRAVKKLKANARFALTGTPVENRLADLWSIFDFVNPGLLGTSKEFGSFAKRLGDRAHGFHEKAGRCQVNFRSSVRGIAQGGGSPLVGGAARATAAWGKPPAPASPWGKGIHVSLPAAAPQAV